MKYAFLVALVVAALLAAACKDSERSAEVMPSPTRSAAVRPEPVAAVPEGVLLVQKDNPRPTTFALEADGEVSEWRRGFHYVTSSDGEHVAFLRGERQDQPDEVVIMTADGKETFRLQAPGADPQGMTWSPDGSKLAYVLWDEVSPEGDLYRVNADGSGQRQVTQEPGPYFIIGWTRDGQILVGGESEVVLIGTNRQAFPLPEGLLDRGEIEMSPDSRYAAAVIGDWERGFAVWLLDLAAGEWRQVADMGLVTRPRSGLYVSVAPPAAPAEAPAAMMKGPPPVTWSPDGRRIAYYRSTADAEGEFGFELRVVDVDSGQDVMVTKEGAWSAAWSADGHYLAETGDGAVYLYDTESGSARTVEVHANRAVWAANGKLLALAPGKSSIIEPASGGVRELRQQGDESLAGLYAFEPVPSPDGRYLAIGTTADYSRANGSLAIIDTRAGEVEVLVETGSFLPVAWLAE